MYDEELQRLFFIDHNTQTTTWVDPRDRYTKKPTFALCEEDELPYGWCRAVDPEVGEYYVDHNTWTTHLPEDMEVYFAQQRSRFRKMIGRHQTDLRHHNMVLHQEKEQLAEAERELEQLRAYMAMPGVSSDRLQENITAAQARVERLQAELSTLQRSVDTKQHGLGLLESDFANLAGVQEERPFYDHAAEANDKIADLERINDLSERQMRERADLSRHLEEQMEIAGQSGDHDAVQEQRQKLKELESKLIKTHLAQMNALKEELAAKRQDAAEARRAEASQRLIRADSRRGQRAPAAATTRTTGSDDVEAMRVPSSAAETELARKVQAQAAMLARQQDDFRSTLEDVNRLIQLDSEQMHHSEELMDLRQQLLDQRNDALKRRELVNEIELANLLQEEQSAKATLQQDERLRKELAMRARENQELRETIANMQRVVSAAEAEEGKEGGDGMGLEMV